MQQQQCKSSAAHAAGRRCRCGSRRGSRCGRGRGRGRGPREGLCLWGEGNMTSGGREREQGGGIRERKGGQRQLN